MWKPLALTAALLGCLGGAPEQDGALPVTTDTPEYCLELAERMAARFAMSANARVLWQHGRAMCERGQIRPGLARLRRAMVLMNGAGE